MNNLEATTKFILSSITQVGPFRIMPGARFAEEMNAALHLQAGGTAVVEFKRGRRRRGKAATKTCLLWSVRLKSKHEIAREEYAARMAARSLDEKILDAASKDGWNVARKGIGFTVGVHGGIDHPMYGDAFVKANKRTIDACFNRFMSRMFGVRSVDGWCRLYSKRDDWDMEGSVKEAWMEGYNAGIEEICRDASY